MFFISEFTLRSHGGSQVIRLLALNKAQIFSKINMVVECLPSFEGIILGQPLRLSCPVAPIRPLEASILPKWTWDIAKPPFCVLVPALFIVLNRYACAL